MPAWRGRRRYAPAVDSGAVGLLLGLACLLPCAFFSLVWVFALAVLGVNGISRSGDPE
jgi:hypothetical protein